MLNKIIHKLVKNTDLTEEEAMETLNIIMTDDATNFQIGAFLTALKIKGETIDEITGFVKVMREKAEKITPDVEFCIDTCGTGGDGTETFNISTAAAIVAASGGVTVAKHGNRYISSKSGSADVLEALGVDISLPLDKVKECIERIGIGFMFAPDFNKAIQIVHSTKKDIGIKTAFDILGPLTNPANAKGQVLGVFHENLTERIARVLLNLNIERAMVVHGLDGMDEITTTTKTKISELLGNQVLNYEISPEMFGMKIASKEDLKISSAEESAQTILSILEGEICPKRDIVILNAAAALYIGKVARTFKQGVAIASELIDSKRALKKLYELKGFTNSCR